MCEPRATPPPALVADRENRVSGASRRCSSNTGLSASTLYPAANHSSLCRVSSADCSATATSPTPAAVSSASQSSLERFAKIPASRSTSSGSCSARDAAVANRSSPARSTVESVEEERAAESSAQSRSYGAASITQPSAAGYMR